MEIPQPSPKEVNKYLKRWDSTESYFLQEKSLNKLFTKTYPSNKDFEDVLIKVCALNTVYGTNIYFPFMVAKHIVNLKIDGKLQRGDLGIVNEVARVAMKNGEKNFYSFATKYCSFHNPEAYPIYDSYVEKILMYFRKKDKFYSFARIDLKSYPVFKKVLLEFVAFYKLDSFSLKQVDQYLWLAGKEAFPNSY